MAAAPAGSLVFVFCAAVMVIAVAKSADGETASVVVGQAKCTDCTRKNMKAEAVFKGLHVVIKCNNSHGEYEPKAVSSLDSSGAFSIPLAADAVRSADCFAQLNSVEGTPCFGQEPSWIHPFTKGTYVAVAGKTHYASSQCSAAICAWIKEHIFDHIHNHKKHFIDHFFHGSPSPAPSN